MGFRKTFKHELLKICNRRNIAVFFILSAFAFLLLFHSLIRYNGYLSDVESFQEAEKVKVRQYVLYTQLGGFGVRLIFLPSPSAVLFSDSFSKMFSNVNTAEKLSIYKPFKGESVFDGSGGYMTFAGIVFLFGGFLSLLSGFLTFRNRDYIKFSAVNVGYKNSFFYLAISRLFVIYLCFGVLAILTLFFVLLNVGFVPRFLLIYFGTCFLMLTFFFSIGLPVGFISEKGKSLILLFTIYFLFIFAFPGLVNKLNSFSASELEKYFDFELKNIKLYTEVERRLIDRFGKLDPNKAPSGELVKEIKKAVNGEFVQIAERERKMKAAILEKIRINQIFSVIIPTSFFLSGMQEMSSTGLLNYIDFYTYNQKMKKIFLDFYIEKSYQSQKKPGKVESFIKGDENIFQAQPRLPHAFWIGVVLTLFYTVLLLFLSYRKFSQVTAESPAGTTAGGVSISEGSTFDFIRCKSESVKAGIVGRYKKEKSAVVLHRIKPEDFRFSGAQPGELLRHLVDVAGVSLEKAQENLDIMSFRGIEGKGVELTDDVILTIYTAVVTSKEVDLFVLDEFLKQVSTEFEYYSKQLINHLLESGKKVVYLSTKMYNTVNPLESKEIPNQYQVIRVKSGDISQIVLR